MCRQVIGIIAIFKKECYSKQELVHNVDSFVVFCHAGYVIEPEDVIRWLVNHVNKLARIGELLC